MKIIKESYTNSDIIIWASPVYVNNISGSMKNMIDRIGYWCHLFKFAGKRAIIIITTDNSGASSVANYLYEVLSFLGAADIKTIIYNKRQDNLQEIKNKISDIANEFIYNIQNEIPLQPNSLSEHAFESFKNLYKASNVPSIEKNIGLNLV